MNQSAKMCNDDAVVDSQHTVLPSCVTVLKQGSVNIYIVGTAHFSKPSQEDVVEVRCFIQINANMNVKIRIALFIFFR